MGGAERCQEACAVLDARGREAEILGLIAQGLTSHTIKTHINRIFAKSGSRDRVAAIGYAPAPWHPVTAAALPITIRSDAFDETDVATAGSPADSASLTSASFARPGSGCP